MEWIGYGIVGVFGVSIMVVIGITAAAFCIKKITKIFRRF